MKTTKHHINSFNSADELLKRFSAGSHEAFAVIYDRFYPSVFYFVKRKINNGDDANDIVAEIFIKFWKSGKKDFDSLEGVRAYLLRSAHNACINLRRDQEVASKRREEFMYTSGSELVTENKEDEYRAELMRRILEAVDRLPKKCRQVFMMAYFQQMKNEEIAEELNLSYKTVRNQKNRALNLLRLAFIGEKIISLILYFTLIAFLL